MRYLSDFIKKDLENRKMVFIGGPRQVGKTTLSLWFLGPDADESHPAYFNWDDSGSRERALTKSFPSGSELLVFDEIHKYPNWRNFLKGVFDTNKSRYRIIVTGSARLDYYRKGGDSLFGRYFYYRLHPLSLGELKTGNVQGNLQDLARWGGFPEPFFSKDPVFWKRWQNARRSRVLIEDLTSMERVADVSRLDLLASMLTRRVGSLLSVNSIAQDLNASPKSVERWLQIFENLYFCFRIPPFGSKELAKALKKEKKLYLWDWSTIEDPGPRLENMVAGFLLKYCHRMEDTEGDTMELRFFRDREKREIDFVVLRNSQPLFAVEVKSKPGPFSEHFNYCLKRTDIPYYYQVFLTGDGDTICGDGRPFRQLPLATFCREVLEV